MSQTVKLKVMMTNFEAIRRACVRMDVEEPNKGSERLWDGRSRVGTIVRLPGWKFPVVISETGEAVFDNHNGHWGDISQLDRLSQFYVVENTRIEAENTGGVVTENEDTAGDIQLEVQYAYATN